jgi:hypothetical protein
MDTSAAWSEDEAETDEEDLATRQRRSRRPPRTPLEPGPLEPGLSPAMRDAGDARSAMRGP